MKYLFLLFLIIIPFQISAQVFYNTSEKATIKITPATPSPGETVFATVRDDMYSDLSKSVIVWHIDEIEKKREIGGTTFQFQAPANGKKIELFATVDKGFGNVSAGFLNIQTGDLDLIYEAETYVPPFYKGRSIFTPQSAVKVAAVTNFIENGERIPKNKIIYNWYKNDDYVVEYSGIGKDSAIFAGDLIERPISIKVIAESSTSNLIAKKEIILKSKNPKVILYENNPIYGSMFEKALTGTFNFDREEVGITAVPYFFSTNLRDNPNLEYSWYENNKKISSGNLGSFINYLNPNMEKNGFSNLMVNIKNNQSFLQSGKNDFDINVLGNQQSDTIKTNETSAF